VIISFVSLGCELIIYPRDTFSPALSSNTMFGSLRENVGVALPFMNT
jgi:hypothetical protein